MNRFRPGTPTEGCAYPKPVRQKRIVKRGKDVEKSVESHNDILFGCISVLQDSYPEFGFLHIPDSIYSLISISGDLSHVFARSLGLQHGMELKEEIADAIKNVADLMIWTPPVRGKYKLSIIGEIKAGSDYIRKGQRNWAKGSMFEWRSVNDFKNDMLKLSDIYKHISKVAQND